MGSAPKKALTPIEDLRGESGLSSETRSIGVGEEYLALYRLPEWRFDPGQSRTRDLVAEERELV